MMPLKAADEADDGTTPDTPCGFVRDAEEEGTKAPTSVGDEATSRKVDRTAANFIVVRVIVS